jgi:5'-nucleotidase
MHTLNRRKFLALAGISSAAALSGFSVMAAMKPSLKRLTILHTNDTHSRLDSYPPNDPNFPNMGGYARRAALVNSFRQEDPQLLLLDAGDIFQGTPYYNMFGGEPELKLMSMMGYDAATFGNHEFDNGLDGFLEVLPHAEFPFVSANYDFSDTILDGKIKPYVVIEKNGAKVGIYGLGIDPKGLVSPSLYGETKYLDPIEIARETEKELKKKHKCSLIICLSHLGFKYEHDKVSDLILASETYHTDVIIGGHTHTLLDPAVKELNQQNKEVTIAQTGSGGVRLGKIEVLFDADSNKKLVEAHTTKIFKNQVA